MQPMTPARLAIFREFQEILLSAVATQDELASLVRFSTGTSLDEVSADGSLRKQVAALAEWAVTRNQLVPIVRDLARDRPNRADVQDFAARIGAAPPRPPPPLPPATPRPAEHPAWRPARVEQPTERIAPPPSPPAGRPLPPLPPGMTGEEALRFSRLLASLGSRDAIDQACRLAFDCPLAFVVADGSLRDMAFRLVGYAESLGRIAELLAAVATLFPDTPGLDDFRAHLAERGVI